MKPPPFEYYAPDSLEQALELMAKYGGEAKVLAGGQSLIPTMNFRLAQPEVLVDLNNISELAHIGSGSDGGLTIGAMTRQRTVERSSIIADQAPLVYETMPYIAHPQIRNRGTFGGSVAHADPAAELPAVVVALNAQLHLRSRDRERWITASDFFVDLFETDLGPEELLVDILLPDLPGRTGCAFEEVSRRQGDYALVGAAAILTLDDHSRCQQVKLVYFSVGNGPMEAHQAEALLQGQELSPEAIQAAAEVAASNDIDPPGDIHASTAFRRHLAKVIGRRVLEKAAARANSQ